MGCQRSHYCLLWCCLLLIGHFQGSLQIAIKKADIPSAIKAGEESVTLDCDYEFGKTSTKGLVVKWYMNQFDLVYQWIYGTAPQAIDPVAKYIDLSYKAGEDPYTMYRAMKLTRPDIDLTGNYTCQISTFEDEVSLTRPVTVYSTGQDEDFKLSFTNANDDDGLEVSCQALGLYPKPTLEISVEGIPSVRSPRPIITETKDGHYNIDSYLTLENDNLPDPVVINCVLGIPGVNFNATKKLVHLKPGRPTTTATAITVGGTTKLLRKMEIQALDNSQADASNGGGNAGNRMRSSCVFLLANVAATILRYI